MDLDKDTRKELLELLQRVSLALEAISLALQKTIGDANYILGNIEGTRESLEIYTKPENEYE